MHRIYHDFNKVDGSAAVRVWTAPLVCLGTKRDLDALGLTLEEGMEILLYMPDEGPGGLMEELQVQAKVRFDAQKKCFVADFIGEDLMYRSEAEAKRKKEGPNQPPEPMPLKRHGSP